MSDEPWADGPMAGVKVLDWTYPDLRRQPPQAYFRAAREIYLRQLRERRG